MDPALSDRYPEFAKAPDSLVLSVLREAAMEVKESAYGDQREIALFSRAADLLARSPFGRSLKLVADDDTTIYEKRFKEITATTRGATGIMVL